MLSRLVVSLVAALVAIPLLSVPASAQVAAPPAAELLGSDPDSPFSPSLCPVDTAYRIEGESEVKIGTSQEYRVALPPSGSGTAVTINYSLFRDGELIETVSGQEKFLRLFSSPGDAVIEARVEYGDGCVAVVEKPIRIYRTLVAYVSGDFSWLDEGLAELLVKRSVLLRKIDIASQGGFLDAGNPVSDTLYKQWPSLREADTIVVDSSDPIPVLGALERVRANSTENTSLHGKNIYVVSEIRTSLLGKLLASSIKLLGLSDVGVLRPQSVVGFLAQINSSSSAELPIETISYSEISRFYSLGGVVEYVSYEGFPVSFLGLLLSLAVVTLLLNFLKQIVGVYVFGVYNPILLALSLAVADPRISLACLAVAFLAVAVTAFFARRFYLLYNAKRSLLVTLYILFSIALVALAHAVGFGEFVNSAFANPFALFPVFFMAVVADKVFHEDIDVFSRGGAASLAQFMGISLLAFWILSSVTVRYFLLSYPDTLLLVAFLNLAIGRYTGLQVFEYARFLPLIGKLREEE